MTSPITLGLRRRPSSAAISTGARQRNSPPSMVTKKDGQKPLRQE